MNLKKTKCSVTSSERRILIFIAQGLSNQEIARKLEASIYTINTHVENICFKLCAKNRTHAVVKALIDGQITLEEIVKLLD